MIVVDCSAIVHLVAADTVDDDMADLLASESIHAPHLLDTEVLHALRGLLLGHKISTGRAERARSLYLQTRVNRYAASGLADRVWTLRHNLTAYDATYVALAEALGCPLVTRDSKLGVAGHRAEVRLYGGPSR
jgi:predicted nucleic acid-binding protein